MPPSECSHRHTELKVPSRPLPTFEGGTRHACRAQNILSCAGRVVTVTAGKPRRIRRIWRHRAHGLPARRLVDQLYCQSAAITFAPRLPEAWVNPPASCRVVPGIRESDWMVAVAWLTAALVNLPPA